MADENVNIGLGMGDPENVPQVTMAADNEQNVPSVSLAADSAENVPQVRMAADEEENVPAIELRVSLSDETYAKRSEAWAVGAVDGVDVPDTDPTYHNNSKYYATQAGASATAAAASATAAADSEAYAVGKRNGVDVPDTDPTYHNNSKYYAENAATLTVGKADKVSGATSGDVATLDANGNLTDSGKTLGVSVPADAKFTDTVPAAVYSSKAESTLGDVVFVTINATFSSYAKRAGNVFALIIPSDLTCGQIGKGTQFKLKVNNTTAQAMLVDGSAQFNSMYILTKGIYYVYDDESYYYMRTDGLSTPKINGQVIGAASVVSGDDYMITI